MTIEIENLEKKYENFHAVKNLNFIIKPGSIVGLLGTKWVRKNHDNWNDPWINKTNEW